MNNKEAIISRVYLTKAGETVISFKLKFGDLSNQEKDDLGLLWREGVPVSIAIEKFQSPNPS